MAELSDRQAEIMAIARAEGRVFVDALAERFAVTTQTIRRDLNVLAQDGLLARMHGGAALTSRTQNVGYGERRMMALEAKRAIGERAAALIPDGCSVSLTIGTTTEQVAMALRGKRKIMVVTNNINIANIMSGAGDAEVVLAGGHVRPADGAIVGADTVSFMSRFKTDFAVIGASALEEDGSILDYDLREVAVSRVTAANARHAMLVCDGEKFERTAAVRICELADLDVFVTDRPPPIRFREACAQSGVEIEIAPATADV